MLHDGLQYSTFQVLHEQTCKDRWDPEPCAIIVCLECLGCDALAAVCYFL